MNSYLQGLSKWKAIGYIVILFMVFIAGNLLCSLPFDFIFIFIKLPYGWMYRGLRVVGCLIGTYFLFYFFTKKFLHTKMEAFRIGKVHIKGSSAVYALLLPTFVLMGFIICGRLMLNTDLKGNEVIDIILKALFSAVQAGILEEMLFRGYIMKLVEVKWNKYIAIIMPSFLFSLAHIPSMGDFNSISLLLLICSGTLVGGLFSLIAYKDHSIWGAALVHALWNFIMCGDIVHIYFGESLSEKAIFSILLPLQNPLLTGASFGAEASILAIMGYALIIALTVFGIKKQDNI